MLVCFMCDLSVLPVGPKEATRLPPAPHICPHGAFSLYVLKCVLTFPHRSMVVAVRNVITLPLSDWAG